jgi:hypothetical protein
MRQPDYFASVNFSLHFFVDRQPSRMIRKKQMADKGFYGDALA